MPPRYAYRMYLVKYKGVQKYFCGMLDTRRCDAVRVYPMPTNKLKLALLAIALLPSCASDPNYVSASAPSCSESVTSYYDRGCYLSDVTRNPPVPLTAGEVVFICRNDQSIIEGTHCAGEFEDWLYCMDSNPGCNCDPEIDAYVICAGTL